MHNILVSNFNSTRHKMNSFMFTVPSAGFRDILVNMTEPSACPHRAYNEESRPCVRNILNRETKGIKPFKVGGDGSVRNHSGRNSASDLENECACVYAVVSHSLRPRGLLWTARLPCPWAFPDKNTGAGRHFLLQGPS